MYVYKKMSEMIFIQFVLMILAFFTIKYGAYVMTEEVGMPRWLNYQPWICDLCLTFWSLIFTYTILGLSFGWYYLMVGGIILAVLNAVAMKIHQRNNTIKL